MVHVLLCGGAGTRLWPLSNKNTPKQLLKLFAGQSLLQLTLKRNESVSDRVLAIASELQSELVQEQLKEVATGKGISIIAEPTGRNTAAAIALAALVAEPEELLLVTPADQLIGTPGLYAEAIEQAVAFAAAGNLVTFGLVPLYPESGFGYIQHAGNDVVRFAEKPSMELAEKFIASGDYLWNSGIFCFKASVILEELTKYAPAIVEKATIAAEEWKKTGSISLDHMLNIPSNSIDYAVMEQSTKVKVIPTAIEWSDVGSYEALADALVKSYEWNNDQAVYIQSDCNNNLVIGEEKLVAMVGVQNLVVVNTREAILVLQKGKGQDIKQLHGWVKENRPELL